MCPARTRIFLPTLLEYGRFAILNTPYENAEVDCLYDTGIRVALQAKGAGDGAALSAFTFTCRPAKAPFNCSIN